MSTNDPARGVDEADDKYSKVDAEDVLEDAEELFEKHHEGPPPVDPWASRPSDTGKG